MFDVLAATTRRMKDLDCIVELEFGGEGENWYVCVKSGSWLRKALSTLHRFIPVKPVSTATA